MRFAIAAILVLLSGAVAGPIGSSTAVDDARCAATPPCGPIPVIITILIDKSRGLTFPESNQLELDGKVQYYFDIDQNGYAYDPQKEMGVQMKLNKAPPWVKLTLAPESFKVPLRPQDGCADCIQQEGSPDQWQFIYEHHIHVTVEKLRDPTAEELKRFTKSDGTYRVSFSAVSNDSMAGSDPTGRPAGVMEGYGVKELRFLSSAETAAQESGKGGNAPGPSPGLALLVVLGAAIAIAARRRG